MHLAQLLTLIAAGIGSFGDVSSTSMRVLSQQSIEIAGVTGIRMIQDKSGSVHLFMAADDGGRDVVRLATLSSDLGRVSDLREIVKVRGDVYFSCGLWKGLPAIVWQDDGAHINLQYDVTSPHPRAMQIVACGSGAVLGSPTLCSGAGGESRIVWSCSHHERLRKPWPAKEAKSVAQVFAESEERLIACHSVSGCGESTGRVQHAPDTLLVKAQGEPYLVCALPEVDLIFDIGSSGKGKSCCSLYELPKDGKQPVRINYLGLETKSAWTFPSATGDGVLLVAEGPTDEDSGACDLECAFFSRDSSATLASAVERRSPRCGAPHALFDSVAGPVLLLWKGPLNTLVWCVGSKEDWTSPFTSDLPAGEEMSGISTDGNSGYVATAIPGHVMVYRVSWK